MTTGRRGRKPKAEQSVVEETAVEEGVEEEEVAEEEVAEEEVAEEAVEEEATEETEEVAEVAEVAEVEEAPAPEPAPVVTDALDGASLEDQAKATVTEEVGHNECPYCGCVDTLAPAGIIQSAELHEYRCNMCGKVHGYNLVLQKIAWMNT